MEANHMSSYDFLQNNCQHFVLALIRRIVMTQRKPLAVGGTRLQIAQWSMGLPGYELVPWLSPWKRRLLLLPKSYSKKFPKRYLVTHQVPLAAHFYLTATLPRILHSVFWEKSWAQRLQDLRASSDPLREARRQWKALDKPSWPKHDMSALFLWGAITYGIDIIVTVYFPVAVAPAMVALPSIDIMIAFAWNLGFVVAAASPFVFLLCAKLFFNRGSLTIQQMDLKRTRPGRHEMGDAHASTSTDDSKDEELSDSCSDDDDDDDDDHEEGHQEGKCDERLFPFCYADIKALEAAGHEEDEVFDHEESDPPLYDSHDDLQFRPPLPPRH